MPFDWYTFNITDFMPWLGTVIQNIYYIWVALWTDLAYLPNVGIKQWPTWVVNLWNILLFDAENNPNWLGSLNIMEFALGSYLIIVVAFLVVKVILNIFKK